MPENEFVHLRDERDLKSRVRDVFHRALGDIREMRGAAPRISVFSACKDPALKGAAAVAADDFP